MFFEQPARHSAAAKTRADFTYRLYLAGVGAAPERDKLEEGRLLLATTRAAGGSQSARAARGVRTRHMDATSIVTFWMLSVVLVARHGLLLQR